MPYLRISHFFIICGSYLIVLHFILIWFLKGLNMYYVNFYVCLLRKNIYIQ